MCKLSMAGHQTMLMFKTDLQCCCSEHAAAEDAPKKEDPPSEANTMLGPFPEVARQILPHGCPAGQNLRNKKSGFWVHFVCLFVYPCIAKEAH